MKYKFMIGIAGILALFSSALTAFGMANLFAASGLLILTLFVVIDLGRFILFNFLVDEWKNLRKIKYIISFILILLFIYSAVGIYAKLDNLVSPATKQAMTEAAYYNKSNQNANLNETYSTEALIIAKEEYTTAIEWNKKDLENCLLRAKNALNQAEAENKCNNTKRRLDQKASNMLKAAQNATKTALITTEQTIQDQSKNQNEIASVLTTICKLTGKECTTYADFQLALSIVIFLVIIGTDYLQIAIVLAVNTRKNKDALPFSSPQPIFHQKIEKTQVKNITQSTSIPKIHIEAEAKPEKIKSDVPSLPENSIATVKRINLSAKPKSIYDF